ncbi:MAG: hypothetical protein AB7O97_00060 [Planctomycetota bacterium]
MIAWGLALGAFAAQSCFTLGMWSGPPLVEAQRDGDEFTMAAGAATLLVPVEQLPEHLHSGYGRDPAQRWLRLVPEEHATALAQLLELQARGIVTGVECRLSFSGPSDPRPPSAGVRLGGSLRDALPDDLRPADGLRIDLLALRVAVDAGCAGSWTSEPPAADAALLDAYVAHLHTGRGVADTAVKALLTPATVALDLVTSPLQLILFAAWSFS